MPRQDGLAGSRVCRHLEHIGRLAVAPLLEKGVLNKPFACAFHANWVPMFCLFIKRLVEILYDFVFIGSVASLNTHHVKDVSYVRESVRLLFCINAHVRCQCQIRTMVVCSRAIVDLGSWPNIGLLIGPVVVVLPGVTFSHNVLGVLGRGTARSAVEVFLLVVHWRFEMNSDDCWKIR